MPSSWPLRARWAWSINAIIGSWRNRLGVVAHAHQRALRGHGFGVAVLRHLVIHALSPSRLGRQERDGAGAGCDNAVQRRATAERDRQSVTGGQ